MPVSYTHLDVYKRQVQCILHVAASGDIQLAYNVQRRGTEHLIFFIPERLRRRHHDTVAGMHTYRVNIFHITHSDTVAVSVPHHFVFDLFPPRNTALNEYLPHT